MVLSWVMHASQSVEWLISIVAAFVAATMDVRTHRIPNNLTGPILLAGLVCSTATRGWLGLFDSLSGVLVAGLPFFILWTLKAGGAGDAKMMGALGACLGAINGAILLLSVALIGGAVSIAYALRRKRLGQALGNVLLLMKATAFLLFTGRKIANRRELIPPIQSPQAFPYGIAIFLGTISAAIVAMGLKEKWI